MRKASSSDYSNGDNFAQEMRGQPRKSFFERQKNMMSHAHSFDNEDHARYHAQRSEPAKNAMRVQLRRIERLF